MGIQVGLFKRRSRVPDLQPEQYQRVAEAFCDRVNLRSERLHEYLSQYDNVSGEPISDVVFKRRILAHSNDIIGSFVEFSILPLEDVYLLHGNSRFMPFVARYSDSVWRVYFSDDVQHRVRLMSGQGVRIDSAQGATFMRPFIEERIGFGEEPFHGAWKVQSAADVQRVCDYLILDSLNEVWLSVRGEFPGEHKPIALACGWVLLQWLEWSAATPDAFIPSVSGDY